MYKYILEDGTYFLTDEKTGEILKGMDEIAIAFDKGEIGGMWTLLKHGKPDFVQAWYNATVEKYKQADLGDIARNLVLIIGKFPLDELNRAIENPGYIKKMVEKLELEV